MTGEYILGLDMGGTRLKALALSPQGRFLAYDTEPTGGPDWAERVRTAADRMAVRLGQAPAAIGLAAPGLTAPDQRSIAFMPSRLPGLEGLDWTQHLGARLPVPVLNDAHAALLGEVWMGGARGERNVLLLTLGTGVGGAAMVDGHLLRGHISRAGHVGHITLDPQGAPDILGTPGSLEDAVGNASLARRSGGRYSATINLVHDARHGVPEACAIWERMTRDLAAAIASLVNVLDPAVVLLGGGIAEAGDFLREALDAHLDVFEWRPGGHRVRLARAHLGDRAGAYGAAWQALQQLETTSQ